MWQAAYVHNRTITLTASMKSPYEMLLKKPLNNSTIKVFGGRALVHKHCVQAMNKFDCHAERRDYIRDQEEDFTESLSPHEGRL